MSITFDVLGNAGRDNALLVRIDSGQSVERLLFDCGEHCLDGVSFGEIQAIDELFFSHLHMDHIGGFDSFFRAVFNRESKLNQIWGPPHTSTILQHRFQGFLWNLHAEMSGTWRVNDIDGETITTTRFELAEAFAIAHVEGRFESKQPLLDRIGYTVEAHTMDHRTPTIAYVVKEKPRANIDTRRISAMGLRPGPWMKQLKDSTDKADTVMINGNSYSLPQLREQLLVETAGDSIAYLTDFLLDEPTISRLSDILQGCHTVVCESQYRQSDAALAQKNYHMTTTLSGQMARRANISRLVLFHLSDRYQPQEWLEMLQEAQHEFPATSFPAEWKLEASIASDK